MLLKKEKINTFSRCETDYTLFQIENIWIIECADWQWLDTKQYFFDDETEAKEAFEIMKNGGWPEELIID